MKANCVERHAASIRPFPLSTLLALSLGSSLTNGCCLFVYLQFASRLASFLLFKEVIYNSIHVYAPHSGRSTVVEHRPVFTPYSHTKFQSKYTCNVMKASRQQL